MDKYFPAAWLARSYEPLKVEGLRLEVDGVEEVEGARACPEPVEGACPELVEGACPELVEGACPELVEGACPELVEGACPELVEGLKAGEADLEPSTFNLAPYLTVHVLPQPDHTYVIGADPAEGNPQSDESAAVVLDLANGEQVATLGLRCDPEMFAVHLNRLAKAYGSVTHTRYGSFPYTAGILVEHNNHGHAVLLVLRQLGAYLLHGLDNEPGWATTGASKSMLFDLAAKDIRERGLRLHDETTFWQLTAIDGATLAAPPGQHDDRAIACVLALAALRSCRPGLVSVPAIPPVDVIWQADHAPWRRKLDGHW